MKRFHANQLAVQLELLGLPMGRSGFHGIVDSQLLASWNTYVEEPKKKKPKDEILYSASGEEYYRIDIFFQDLGKRGSLAISYVSLFEILDPRREPGSDPNAAERTLNKSEMQTMEARVQRLKEFGIGVVDPDTKIFRLAIDLWYDSRQNRLGNLRDAALLDPLIAATALVHGVPLYSNNIRHFAPLYPRYPLDLQEVAQEKGYWRLVNP